MINEELQKIIDEQSEKRVMETKEECKKEFVKTSLEEKLSIETIKRIAKVNGQFIYNVANENNLQVNEGWIPWIRTLLLYRLPNTKSY